MNRYIIALFLILLLKAAAIIGVILYAGIGLGPDEAQYWTWSRDLAWGYYSKPPGISWQIWLGTKLFGNTELGVRFLAIIFSSLLSFSVFFLALACKLKPQTAFSAGLVMALTPLGVLSSFLATTDGGFVLFWTVACILVASALSRDSIPNYYLVGVAIFCGALFKWPIYLFWVLIVGFMPFYRCLISWHFFGGIFISLLGLLPSVIWNSTHEWVTFRHVFSTITGRLVDIPVKPKTDAIPTFLHGNFFDFIGAQILLLSPIIFALLVLSFVALFRRRQMLSPSLIFCGGSCLILLVAYSVMAVFQKMQGNWVVFAYPPGIVLLSWYSFDVLTRGTTWLKGGIALSVILCAVMLSIPYIQSHALFSRYPISYKINPFRQNVGWDRLENQLSEVGYDPQEQFLFGDRYQMSSILSFYSPGQKRAYFLNLQGIRKNQFSFWPSMAQEQRGRTGFFVLAENMPALERAQSELITSYQTTLEHYFREVHFLGVKPLFLSYDQLSKGALIFKCIDYNGQEPVDVELY